MPYWKWIRLQCRRYNIDHWQFLLQLIKHFSGLRETVVSCIIFVSISYILLLSDVYDRFYLLLLLINFRLRVHCVTSLLFMFWTTSIFSRHTRSYARFDHFMMVLSVFWEGFFGDNLMDVLWEDVCACVCMCVWYLQSDARRKIVTVGCNLHILSTKVSCDVVLYIIHVNKVVINLWNLILIHCRNRNWLKW